MPIDQLLEDCRKLYEKDSLGEVIERCDEILEMDPNHKIALDYKTRCLYFLDRLDEALTLINHSISLYPTKYYFRRTKAEILMAKEEYDKAIACFRKAFELEGFDEAEYRFMFMHYETCFSLYIDRLIDGEKYVQAFETYAQLLKVQSKKLKRKDMIGEIISKIRQKTTTPKVTEYNVTSSPELIEFLKNNGFNGSGGEIIRINVVEKTYCKSTDDSTVSLSKFLDKVNYYPRDEIVRKKLYDDENRLLYDGYTIDCMPYGFGVMYFPDGTVYREGIFDVKGIVQGKEFYPSGQLRFKGTWSITYGYGPNAPKEGEVYSEDGKMTFRGKFEIKKGGVGFPMIISPKGYRHEQENCPKIQYYRRF